MKEEVSIPVSARKQMLRITQMALSCYFHPFLFMTIQQLLKCFTSRRLFE